MSSDKEVYAAIGEEGYTVNIKAGKHSLISDEPVKYGGQDLGATPYGLLAASLGACTAMTMKMYAKRKGWELKEAIVYLEHGRSYAEDCEDCDKPDTRLYSIHRIIELEGTLTAEQKDRLLEIADKCPVHKTLSPCIKITTSLKE